MKNFLPALLSLIFFSFPAVAQKYTDLDYMRVTSDVARNLNHPSLANYYGWVIDSSTWHDTLNDSLFGPFLATQEEKPGRAMSCMILEFTNNDVVCVYFQDEKPYGYISIKTEAGTAFTVDQVKAAFKAITPELLLKPGQKQTSPAIQPAAETKSLSNVDMVRIASDIAYNLQHDSLDYYNGFIISDQDWKGALTDSLFGPFLAAQEPKPGRQLVCIISEMSNDTTCVYFDQDKPYGVVSLKVDIGSKFTDEAIKAAYKPITPEILNKPANRQNNKILEGHSVLDNKMLIPVDVITEVQ